MAATLLHALAPVSARAAARLELPRRLPASDGVVLSFDDGPHPEGTPAVLEVLAAAGARATFFLVGEQVVRHPGLAARIAADGHLVALHGYRHRLQLRLSTRQLDEDYRRGTAAVADATGQPVDWHRPPYGVYSPAGLEAAHGLGLRPLLWSRWGKDWRRFTTPERVAARATRGVQEGDVILLHDADYYSSTGSYRRTVQALGPILEQLDRLGRATVLPV